MSLKKKLLSNQVFHSTAAVASTVLTHKHKTYLSIRFFFAKETGKRDWIRKCLYVDIVALVVVEISDKNKSDYRILLLFDIHIHKGNRKIEFFEDFYI